MTDHRYPGEIEFMSGTKYKLGDRVLFWTHRGPLSGTLHKIDLSNGAYPLFITPDDFDKAIEAGCGWKLKEPAPNGPTDYLRERENGSAGGLVRPAEGEPLTDAERSFNLEVAALQTKERLTRNEAIRKLSEDVLA